MFISPCTVIIKVNSEIREISDLCVHCNLNKATLLKNQFFMRMIFPDTDSIESVNITC